MLRIITMIAVAFSMSACMRQADVTRASASDPGLLSSKTKAVALPLDIRVSSVNVKVSRDLTVSESNSFKPLADIVWREDPIGDRYDQVQAIVQNALEQGVSSLNGKHDVILDVEMSQFHALTQRTRYTYGGKHEIGFSYRLIDANTGEIIQNNQEIYTEFRAFGGYEAIAAEMRGETQKVRITAHLVSKISELLQKPVPVVTPKFQVAEN